MDQGKDGKLTKPPFRADAPHLHASSTDPSTWCNLDVAMGAYCRGEVDGIGFALSGSEIGAEDLDDCRIAESGVLNPWAAEQIRRAGSYAEVTPSKEGVRVIGLASGPPVHRKFNVPNNGGMSCELYRRADRYICITGQQIGNATQLANIDAQIDALHAELDGAKRANGAKQSAKQGKSGKNGKQRDLDALIKDGCGEDFGGDRSRATWYVIHALLKQGRSPDDIVGILIDPANGISAHCLDQSRPEEYARKQVEKAQQESAGGDDTDAEIERLAKLSAIQYEQERKAAAEQLNVRASILDRLVQAERERLGLCGDDAKQGQAIALPEPQPWPQPVDGPALLDGIAEALARHVVMPEYARHATALWIVHCYLLDCFLVSPRLGVRSPMKRCGKTTLLDIIGRLIWRPLPTANVTAAALFRVVEAYRPTLLVDEADTFLAEADELRGVLNSGHRKGGQVLRTVGDEHEPRSFSTYSAVAIAVIGNLPDTLADRSVIVDLKRRLPSESIESFRSDRAAHLDVLARQTTRWAADNAARVAEVDPVMPASLYNRDADNWRPLLAIAEVTGGEWPERARAAALKAQEASGGDDATLVELLLGDIRDTFAKRKKNKVERPEEIPSGILVEGLVAIEGRPWAELGRSRKPLTQNRLARLLKPLAIAPGNVGPEENRVRGYLLEQFKEAFSRYLGPEGASEPPSRPECDEMGTSADFTTAQPRSRLCSWKIQETQQRRASVRMCSCKGGSPGMQARAATAVAIRALAAHGTVGQGTPSSCRSRPKRSSIWIRPNSMPGCGRSWPRRCCPSSSRSEFERVMAEVFRV